MQCRDCGANLPSEARFCLSCGARVAPRAEALADPLREALDKAIGFQYRIERLLGRGGMGAVYLAHELALERDVAIKVLPPEQAITPELRERFKREARTAARLTHPNIVPLHTFGEVAGLMYFVMGYVAGESLRDRLKRQGAFDSESARLLLASVCDALDYAHRQGIVHRDIKPDNILIDASSGAPLLTDFGIAKATLVDAQLTTTGQLMGTPHYMSPEQAMGKSDVGPRSDLYSLGVVAYEMLSAQRPFQAETPLDALTQRLTQAPRPLRTIAASVAPDLAQAVNRCLQKDPADRWSDAKALREALLPAEDEAPEPQELGILRKVATVVLPLVLLAFVYARLVATIHPEFQAIGRVYGLLSGVTVAMNIVATAMSIRLRLLGFDARTIATRIVQQPTWWRGWYPPALRRRGDVWDRLPSEFRQSRGYRGALLFYMFTVFIPFQLITTWDRQLPTVRRAMLALTLAAVFLLFALRRRAVKCITAKLQVNAAAALMILNTPSWHVSAWRRAPAASLLAAPRASTAPREAAAALQDDGATRVAVTGRSGAP